MGRASVRGRPEDAPADGMLAASTGEEAIAPPPALLADPRARHPAQLAHTASALRGLQGTIGNAGVARLMRATLARDVVVPAPGWGSNLLGDDDSSVSFDPWATFVVDGDDSFFPSDFVDMAGGHGTLKIKAGSKGTVRIKCKVHVFLDQKWNEDIYQDFSFAWRVAADLKGALSFEQLGESIGAPDDSEPGFAITSVKGSEGPSSLKAQVYMVSYQETDVPNVSVGIQGGKGKVEGGANVTLGNETTQPAASITPGPFILNLEVTDIPPEPPPEPTVTIESISMLREHPLHFERENQDKVSSAEEAKLVKWWTKALPPEFREEITSGRVEVELEGTASPTGDAQYNRRLAGRRVAAVEEVLRSFGVTNFKPRAPGEYDPETGEETEEQKGLDRKTRDDSRLEKRKVTVKVWQEFKVPPDGGGGAGPAQP